MSKLVSSDSKNPSKTDIMEAFETENSIRFYTVFDLNNPLPLPVFDELDFILVGIKKVLDNKDVLLLECRRGGDRAIWNISYNFREKIGELSQYFGIINIPSGKSHKRWPVEQ